MLKVHDAGTPDVSPVYSIRVGTDSPSKKCELEACAFPFAQLTGLTGDLKVPFFPHWELFVNARFCPYETKNVPNKKSIKNTLMLPAKPVKMFFVKGEKDGVMIRIKNVFALLNTKQL